MALLRHSGIYFLARILAGGAGFAILASYTRLLDPHAFGELTLLLAGVGFFTLLIGDTPMLALLRYLPAQAAAARATMLWGLMLPAAALCLAAAALLLIAAPAYWRSELALAALLLLVTLLHRFQLATAQGMLKPGQYALLGSLESILDMVLGIAFVWLGYGVTGALLGTLLGALVTLGFNFRGWWIDRGLFEPALARQMLRFGLPLIASALFLWLATFSDRWLIGAFFGAREAGLYAAGYDLQMNLLGVPLAVLQLAGYPLAVNALDTHGIHAAQTQLRQLGAFIILLVLPEAVGIIMTGPLLATIFLGEEFRPLTVSLLPVLVAATFLKVAMIYLTYGYFLSARTHLTLISFAAAAVADIVFNLVLLPHYGTLGAAVAALIGFGAGFAVSAVNLRGVFSFPLPAPSILVAALAGIVTMAAWLYEFRETTAWTLALYIIPIAVAIYFGSVALVLRISGRDPLLLMRALWTK
jgi:O-antigen/teichoic acid export membrane protein